MRNKKLIFVATLIITISVLLCAFVGCNREPKPAQILASFYKDEAETTVKTVELTNLEGYTITQYYSEVVVARKFENEKYSYALVNVEKNEVIATSENNFGRAISGVYSTYKDVEEERIYSFYSKDGVVKESVKQGEYSAEGSRITFNDGTVAVSTKSDIVVFEQTLENSMSMVNFVSSADVYENDDMIIITDDNDCYCFLVYDKDGNFKYSVILATLLNASSEDEIKMVNLAKGKVAIQVKRELTEVEAESGFDYIMDGNYYALSTYVYDLKSKELKAIDFNKIISTYREAKMSKDDNYALLYTQDISNKHLVEAYDIIVTDTELNEKVKINDFVNGAAVFTAIDESTFAITDGVMMYIFNEKGDLVKSYAMALEAQSGFINVGRYFYDLKGNQIFKLDMDAPTWMNIESDGLIYYVKEKDGELSDICIYDSKTKETASYKMENYDEIDVNSRSLCFTISDADGNKTIYGYYDGKAISDKKFATVSARYSGNGYYIITATDANGKTTYFSYKIAAVEK